MAGVGTSTTKRNTADSVAVIRVGDAGFDTFRLLGMRHHRRLKAGRWKPLSSRQLRRSDQVAHLVDKLWLLNVTFFACAGPCPLYLCCTRSPREHQ